MGWPKEHGGKGLPVTQQVIWHQEYARARAPGRVGIVGEGLLGPTLIAFGTDEQKARFLPGIVSGETLWCQGYSEPNAGSDLANVQTRAHLDGDEWVISGQKVWTSLAAWAQWMLRGLQDGPGGRPQAPRHLLPALPDGPARHRDPTDRAGHRRRRSSTRSSSTRPARRRTWSSARSTAAGAWRWAPSASSGACSTLGQQMAFSQEFDLILEAARRNGKVTEPEMRQRLADAWIGLELMRLTALRTISGQPGPETSINKLYWATFHRRLGELAMDVLGAEGTILTSEAAMPGGEAYQLSELQGLFLFSRADTIYGGSNQIQRNVLGEQVLGLPREPR